MRKLATLAVLTLSAGTVLVGGASAANAVINIGNPVPDDGTTAAPAAPANLDFAKTWCGAPWQWNGAQACNSQQGQTPAQ